MADLKVGKRTTFTIYLPAIKKSVDPEKAFNEIVHKGSGKILVMDDQESILKIDTEAKVVVSSGYSNDPIMANFKNYGFVGVIPKPYSRKQMTELLNNLLGEYK